VSRWLPLVKRWLPRVLAVALLAVALDRAGPANVWRGITTADPLAVALSGVLAVPFIVVRALRWRVILRDLDIGVGWWTASRLYAIGLLVGTITPGQAGDAIKAWYLHRRGDSLALGLLSCVLDRLFDILVLTALATSALVVFWPGQPGQALLGLAIIAAVLAGLLFLARPDARGLVLGLPGVRFLWTPIERGLRARPWGAALLDSGLTWPTLPAALLLTGLGFAVTLTRVYLVFIAVGITLPLLPFVAVASLAVFASLVSVSGIGSRDVALIALLAPLGYSEQQAVAASFLILFLNLTNVVPGVLAMIGQPALPRPADAGV
jgi:glycosyltransferase 2 family protein